MERTARLFRNGGSKAVRIPKEFLWEGDDVIITRQQGGVLIRPVFDEDDSFLPLLRELEALGPLGPDEVMPDIDAEDTPPRPVTGFDDRAGSDDT